MQRPDDKAVRGPRQLDDLERRAASTEADRDKAAPAPATKPDDDDER